MGLPCEGGGDCALRELSPLLGSPSPDKKNAEEWDNEGGLDRKKIISGNTADCRRYFNPMNLFAFTQQMPTTHSGTSHLLDTNYYFFFLFYLADVYLLHIQTSEKIIHVIITLNSNGVEYNLMSIRITKAFIFTLLSYLFFHLEQLK